MYTITYDSDTLYDPTNSDYLIQSGSVDLAVGAAGTCTLLVGQENQTLGQLRLMSGIVEVKEGTTPIFRGRIVKDSEDIVHRHKISIEGILATLNDSYVSPYDFPSDYLLDPDYQEAADEGNVVAFWLEKLLDNHNAQVEAEQQILLGNVTVSDPNNYISRSNEKYSTTWETISKKLQDSTLGGYLMVRYESDGTYLDYLSDFSQTNAQSVRFAKNLLDVGAEQNGEDVFTAVLPIGKDNLTIDSITDEVQSEYTHTGKIVYSPAAEATLGVRITKIQTWNDVTEASNLYSKAISMLVDGAGNLPETISVSACDLSGVDNTIPAFQIGQKVMFYLGQSSTGTLYPLTKLKIDLLNKARNTITLGDTKSTVSNRISTSLANIENTVTDIRGTIQEQSEATDDLANRVTTAESSIIQNANAIESTVQMASELGDQLNAELTAIRQTQSAVEVAIQDINENGVSKVVTSTGFRLDSDGLTVSKSGTPMQTNIDEDGMEVTRSGERVLTADSSGVNAINLTARQYLTIGANSRFEDYQSNRTACFFVGG